MGGIDNRAQNFFKSIYDNPVIEILNTAENRVFHSLTFYSVYEEEHLVEDPLIPAIWIRTSKHTFYPANDLAQAMREEGIVPHSGDEAVIIAQGILLLQCNACHTVDGPQSFPGEIPEKYNDRAFFPSVKETPQGYRVHIHLYYPDHRWAEFYSPYRNELVEYSVTNTGSDYQIREEHVYSFKDETEEILLTETVISHIKAKRLVQDLTSFLDKRNLYGITDPPDRTQVLKRIQELSDLWEQAFEQKHKELASLLHSVLHNNPDFRFDSNYLYQKTKKSESVRGIEKYERKLEILLQEMVQRTQS